MNRCGLSGSGSIYYDLDAINIKVNPTTTRSTAFESAFLGDVIEELDGECFRFFENCKSQYPLVNENNFRTWITSLDQDNRVGLAHVLEHSNVPILYNTPRLCDPGMKVSKNWSLKNYIETRLYDFKFKYNMGTDVQNRKQGGCYPKIVLDFRPFEYILVLPMKGAEPIYVSEWITIENQMDVALGYVPHMRLARTPLPAKNSFTTIGIFKQMIRSIIETGFGYSKSSIVKNVMNLGPNNGNVNMYINTFIEFLKKIDGLAFDPPRTLELQSIKMTNDVLTVLYYDMLHDGIFKKTELPLSVKNSPKGKTFFSIVKDQFFKFTNPIVINQFASANRVREEFKIKPGILFGNKFPAIMKTLGDLSQFMYASKHDTVVASGDKMGIACGLYINAVNNKRVKCMIEDSVTGFVIYSGFDNITFTDKRETCIVTRGEACPINTRVTNKAVIANKIRKSTQDQDDLKRIINTKPPRIGKLPSLWLNSPNLNRNAMNTIANTIIKYKNYWTDADAKKLAILRSRYTNKLNAVKMGKIGAIINGLNTNSTIVTRGGGGIKRQLNTNTPRQNLRMYLNNSKFTRLTQNNKRTFLSRLERNGENMNTIKNAALKLQRQRELSSYLNTLRLTPEQKKDIMNQLNNKVSLRNLANKAKRMAFSLR
uniref:Uncharacterized protein n=1 Tax=Mantoniella tinhauana virus 1 TaxID=3111543 RepID=A0AB38ZMF4_9VIRU